MAIAGTVSKIIVVGALALLPLALGQHYFILLMANFFIFALLTTSLQMLVGFSGILSLGHAAFFGIGAYASAILSISFNLPFVAAALGGSVLAGAIGLVMSPIIRLREVYFAIASFAFGIIVSEVFAHWKSVTGGHDGLIMIPFAAIGRVSFDAPSKFYYLAFIVLVAQYIVFSALLRGPFGRALAAMRQNEQAAVGVGLNLSGMKVITIAISATSAGLAGALYAHLYGSISPQTFSWHQSINLLTMVVIGGCIGFSGVFAATFLLLFLPENFRAAAEYSTLINGTILTLFMVAFPQGLSGMSRLALISRVQRIRRKFYDRSPAQAPASSSRNS